jgi:rod shape-determining protein MreC
MAVYRRASRRRYLLLLLTLTAITLITLDSRSGDDGPLGAVGRAAHTVVSPLQRGMAAVARPVGDWLDGIGEAGSLKRENDRLRAELRALENESDVARTLRNENRELNRILELPILDDVPRTAARIVNRSPGNFEWTVEINKGDESGISPDMPVMSAGGLVGKVTESWRGGAKVRLLVDPDSGVGVRVVQEPVTGTARGHAGSKLLRLDLDADANVVVGDLVETSGLPPSVFPPGILVGKVVKVADEPGGLGKMVTVEPAADFDRLEYLVVLEWVPGQGPVMATTTTTTSTSTTTLVPVPEG